jgi:glutaredoxin
MGIVIGICMLLTMAVMAVGGVMMIVAAFRESVLWGLAYLFIPFAALVFLIKYWSQAKKGFLINMAGLCVFLGLFFTSPQIRPALAGLAVNARVPGAAASAKKQKNDFESAISEKRELVSALQANLARLTVESDRQYKELTERRNTLNTNDQAAVDKFNADTAAYLTQAEQFQQLRQQIDATNAELEDLPAKRAAEQKEVVIYSTSWCAACKQAKRYMDSKGINYREVDVEKSAEGGEEYKRQGGDGSVPLIVMGNEKMRGFNPDKLDSMLQGGR